MSLPEFHPFSLDYTADPRPYFAEYHRDNRLVRVEDFNAWAVHGYDAVRSFCDHPQMTRNPTAGVEYDEETLAARIERWPMIEGGMRGSAERGEEGMSLMRELLAPDFRPAMIRKMSATVKDVVQKVCAPLQSEHDLDVVKLVQEVPLIVISKLLGIDESSDDSRLFLTSAPDFFRGINFVATDEDRDKAEQASQDMFTVLARTVEERRAHPQTDMISQILEIAGRLDNVNTEEVIRALVVLVAAGTDTTRLSTSLAVKTLLTFPAEFDALRKDREKVKNAVMELLRYESPTKFLVRIALEDIDWEGHRIDAGSLMLLSIFGAGWDPRVFPNPEVFDIERDLKGSLSFGFGSGYCLGVHLARLQVGTLIEYFLDHLPSTATFDASQITWDPKNLLLREITSMPIHVR